MVVTMTAPSPPADPAVGSKPRRWSRGFLRFVTPLVAFPPMVATGAGLGYALGTAAAIVGVLVVGGALLLLLIRRFGNSLIAAAFLAGICGSGLGYEVSEATRLRAGRSMDIGVAEAPQHPEATLFRFRDGHVLTGFTAQYERVTRSKTSTQRTTYFVAPLVPEGWTVGQPVPAWVGSVQSTGSWHKPWRGGARLDVSDDPENGYRRAIRACESKGLRGAAGAPVLEWVEDPASWPSRRIRKGWDITVILMALYYVGLLCRLGYEML